MKSIFVAEFFTRDIRNRETDRWLEFAGKNFYAVCEEAATLLGQKYGSSVQSSYFNDGESAIYECVETNEHTQERMYAAVYRIMMI